MFDVTRVTRCWYVLALCKSPKTYTKRQLRQSDGVDSAGGVGKFFAGSSEEVDKRSLPFFFHLCNLYCWQLVRGHEFVTCPTLLHPRHTTWDLGIPGDNSTLSTLTVLFSTIFSAGTSGPTEVSTVTSISPGPSSGRVSPGANAHDPSLGS